MEGFVEEHIISDIINYEDKKYGEKPPKVPVPANRNFICHVVFFLLGVCHFLPITFFAAANNFWLHKFRNTTIEDASTSDRTILQRYFAPAALVAYAIPSVAFGVFNITIGNRYKMMHRVILTLGVEVVVFIFLTVGVQVNTDDFQTLYFFMVLLAYATLQGANAVNLVASLNLFPRFPHKYMNTCLAGEGAAGVLGDVLNIMAVWIFGGDITKATFLYFTVGTVVVFTTFALSILMCRSKFFIDCVESVPQDFDIKPPSWKQVANLFYKLRSAALMLTYFVLGIAVTHPSITALVVSEQYDDKTTWATSYFSPVMSFFLSDSCMLLGRMAVSHLPINLLNIESALVLLSTIRTILLIPCVWLCNAQPRSHLPVWFPHDYQYGIILAVFMFTNGNLVNISMLMIPEKVEKGEVDLAYTLYGFAVSLIHALTSPLGLFIVNVL